MAKPCVICAEPGIRDSVDRRLAEGVSIRDVASAVNRSKSAVARHKLHGDDERNEKGVKLGVRRKARRKSLRGSREESSQAGQPGRESIETREDLIGWFQLLLNEATGILELAKRHGDSRLALQAHKAAIESLLQIGKTKGFILPDGQVFVDQRRQSIEVLAKLDEATLRRLAELPAAAIELPSGELTEEAIDAESRAVGA